MFRPALTGMLVVAMASHGVCLARTWTSATGKTFEGDFLSRDETHVRLKRPDGKTVKVAIDKLGNEDQKWLAGKKRTPPTDSVVTTAAADQTVYVGPSSCWAVSTGETTHQGFLAREIARQAFLIAARHELGVETRDAWLGQRLPEAGEDPPFDLTASAGTPSLFELVRGFGAQQTTIWQQEIALAAAPFGYSAYVARLELLSRTEFVANLKQAGFAQHPRASADPATELPESIETLLRPDELHVAIRGTP